MGKGWAKHIPLALVHYSRLPCSLDPAFRPACIFSCLPHVICSWPPCTSQVVRSSLLQHARHPPWRRGLEGVWQSTRMNTRARACTRDVASIHTVHLLASCGFAPGWAANVGVMRNARGRAQAALGRRQRGGKPRALSPALTVAEIEIGNLLVQQGGDPRRN